MNLPLQRIHRVLPWLLLGCWSCLWLRYHASGTPPFRARNSCVSHPVHTYKTSLWLIRRLGEGKERNRLQAALEDVRISLRLSSKERKRKRSGKGRDRTAKIRDGTRDKPGKSRKGRSKTRKGCYMYLWSYLVEPPSQDYITKRKTKIKSQNSNDVKMVVLLLLVLCTFFIINLISYVLHLHLNFAFLFTCMKFKIIYHHFIFKHLVETSFALNFYGILDKF